MEADVAIDGAAIDHLGPSIDRKCGHSVSYNYPDVMVLLAKDVSNGTDILSACQEGRDQTFVVVGNPSTGKSILLEHICRLYVEGKVLKDKKYLWRWDLSLTEHCKVDSLEKLAAIQTTTIQHSMLIETKKNQGRDILIFIDHLTQYNNYLSQLKKSDLPNCAIVIAIQYSSVETVLNHMVNFKLFEMEGLRTEDVHEVMLKMGRELNLKSMDRMIDYVRSDPYLLDLCRIPSMILHVWEVFKRNNYQCPKTVTSLLQSIIDIIVANASRGVPSNETKDHFQCICSLAFRTFNQGEFNKQEFSCTCLEECIPGTGPQIGLGLMQFLNYNGKISCKFVHKTVEVYLAALHVQRQPIFDQVYLMLKITDLIQHRRDKNSELILIYFCGIAHTNSTKTASINVAKMILYPLLETIADKLTVSDHSVKLIFLDCLHEAQEASLVRKFLSRRQHMLSIIFDDHMLTESKLQMLSYCIANSGIKQWKVEAVPDKIYLAEYLNMLIVDHLSSESKSEFKLEVTVGESFRLLPENIKQITPVKLKSNVYSRSIRELLHRLLQLYSPIKLKSDGSNTSYISLLTCQCLKNDMEKNEIFLLEPMVASHWLPVKPKTKKSNSNQQDDNLQTLLHMQQKHENQYIEYVVMMTPFPHRIKFTVPGTKEKVTISLCSSNSPNFLESGIENHLDLSVAPLCVIYQETHFNVQCQRMILPNMPLPEQSHSKAQTVAPDVPEPPRSPIQRQRSSEATVIPVTDTGHTFIDTANRQGLGQGFASRCPEPAAGAYGSPFNYCTNVSQSVHLPQALRQSALNTPGAIVHTTIPSIFVLDQIYPLPDETNLIRRGGNGEIFSGVFGGIELIIKKTSYRNRELMIHGKLRHQNVIPLLCLMIGERHPSQRRKWTCYHFLPRATGDLARLAVDNEQNTLKKMRIKYGNNPKQFGLIQGNVKYILSQILRGLAYLHGLNIVHRDVKASNILLKFHCVCSNPLMCTCAQKCDIQIADYDSALQFTDSGLMPASYTSRMDQTQKIFTIVPVGTTGYRPPECSQLVVANNICSMSPRLTTKLDVWSYGVLMMRMVNGNYGPSSQREEDKWNRMRPDYSKRCTSDDVRKILKLWKLREEVFWNTRAVDCIEKCLQVDPEKRPSAEELLHHSFLY